MSVSVQTNGAWCAPQLSLLNSEKGLLRDSKTCSFRRFPSATSMDPDDVINNDVIVMGPNDVIDDVIVT